MITKHVNISHNEQFYINIKGNGPKSYKTFARTVRIICRLTIRPLHDIALNECHWGFGHSSPPSSSLGHKGQINANHCGRQGQ